MAKDTTPIKDQCWGHVADCVGTDECGLLFSVRLPEPLKTATLSYRFKFSEGFTWTSGGKLPGVCDWGAALLTADSRLLCTQLWCVSHVIHGPTLLWFSEGPDCSCSAVHPKTDAVRELLEFAAGGAVLLFCGLRRAVLQTAPLHVTAPMSHQGGARG